jgi:molybdopterin/thiamine biosynthesis adenylyltransferase
MPERRLERLVANPRIGAAGIQRLRGSRVAVVGCGNLGWPLAREMAQLGVALVLVDPGLIEEANVGTQLVPVDAIGRPKAQVRVEQARATGAEGGLVAHVARVEELGLGVLSDCDLLVGATDSLSSRLAVDATGQRLAIPLLNVALDGSGRTLFGRVALLDPAAGGACLACAYDARALDEASREGHPSGCPSWRRAPTAATPPTLQTSALAAVLGGFAALLAIRVLLEGAAAFAGRALLFDGDEPERTRRVTLERGRHCSHLSALRPLRPARACTVGALLEQAARELGAPPEGIDLHGRLLANGLRCSCGAERELARIAESVPDAELACACGEEMVPARLEGSLPVEEARLLARRSWDELGLPPNDVVSVRAGGRTAHYLVGEERP